MTYYPNELRSCPSCLRSFDFTHFEGTARDEHRCFACRSKAANPAYRKSPTAPEILAEAAAHDAALHALETTKRPPAVKPPTAADGARIRAERNARYHSALARRLYRYGVTKAQYWDLIRDSDKHCDICREAFTAKSRPCVDKDRDADEVRGLLCTKCLRAMNYLSPHAAAVSAYLARTEPKQTPPSIGESE